MRLSLLNITTITAAFLLNPPSVFANDYFAALEKLWGIEPIETLKLTGDDVELRFWVTGFGPSGYLLSRRNGRWRYQHVGENRPTVLATFHGYRSAHLQPLCDPDRLFDQLVSMGALSLEPPRDHPTCQRQPHGQCLNTVMIDGWSAYVELKTAATLKTQNYAVPGLPPFANEDDRPEDYPSYRVTQMYRLLQHALGGRGVIGFEPHSTAFSLPAMVLSRAIYSPGVQAFLIKDYEWSASGGRYHYETRFFTENPQGFSAVVYEDDENEVSLSWQGFHRAFFGHGPGQFRLEPERDQWRAVMVYESAADVRHHELSVSNRQNFKDLTYVDLSSGFERQTSAGINYADCRRATPLSPHLAPPKQAVVFVEGADLNSLSWRVLPPVLQSLTLLNVRGNNDEFWMAVDDVQDYPMNQPVNVTFEKLPPPGSSDKPVWILHPIADDP